MKTSNLENMHFMFALFLIIGFSLVVSEPGDWQFVSGEPGAGNFRYLTHYKKKGNANEAPYVLYIMFNPSTGGVEEGKTDPTIREIMAFTEAPSTVTGWNTVKAFKIINLFSFKNPSPIELLQKLDQKSTSIGNKRAFEFVQGEIEKKVGKKRGKERYDEHSDYWNNLAKNAKFICAAWGDSPDINKVSSQWKTTWIP